MSTYRPRPGTIAHRAIKFLQGYSREWVPGTLIAEVLSLPSAQVGPFFGAPLKHGYLRKRIVHIGAQRRRMSEWAIGPVPLEPPKPKPVPRSKPSGPASIWDYAARRAA